MNILVVHVHKIDDYPPTYNLVKNLLDHGHHVTLLSYDAGKLKTETGNAFTNKEIRGTIATIPRVEKEHINTLRKVRLYLCQKKIFREAFCESAQGQDLIWLTSSASVQILGDALNGRKYVLQLMELEKDVPRYPKQRFIKAGLADYAREAYKVVVPEYNRGQMIKAWWGLSRTPAVLPNKPYSLELKKMSPEEEKVYKAFCEEKRKIILYQGVFGKDRDLTEYAKAAYALREDFVLCLLGRSTELQFESEIEGQLSGNPDTRKFGFIAPPNHLYFTKRAWLGLLPYCAYSDGQSDVLNPVYCAPNKIYEYAAFGVPMLGPDLPGLYYPFTQYGMGKCVDPVSCENIIEAIRKIDANHEEMSRNCKAFYDSVDVGKIVEEIIN